MLCLELGNDYDVFRHDHERSSGGIMLLDNTEFKPLHVYYTYMQAIAFVLLVIQMRTCY